MLPKLHVTVTLHVSPSKEIPDHNTLCFAMLCCLLDSWTYMFIFPLLLAVSSKASGGRTRGPCRHFSSSSTTCILQVVPLTFSSPSMCNISQCLHSCDQFSANKQSAPCLYKCILFIMVGPRACCWRPRAGARTRARARTGSAPGCYVKSASATTTFCKAASHI